MAKLKALVLVARRRGSHAARDKRQEGGGISCHVKFAVVTFTWRNFGKSPWILDFGFCVGNYADTPDSRAMLLTVFEPAPLLQASGATRRGAQGLPTNSSVNTFGGQTPDDTNVQPRVQSLGYGTRMGPKRGSTCTSQNTHDCTTDGHALQTPDFHVEQHHLQRALHQKRYA